MFLLALSWDESWYWMHENESRGFVGSTPLLVLLGPISCFRAQKSPPFPSWKAALLSYVDISVWKGNGTCKIKPSISETKAHTLLTMLGCLSLNILIQSVIRTCISWGAVRCVEGRWDIRSNNLCEQLRLPTCPHKSFSFRYILKKQVGWSQWPDNALRYRIRKGWRQNASLHWMPVAQL